MKPVFWLEFQIYIDNEEDFDPFDIYKIIGLKPTFCKKHQKDSIRLLNGKWKEALHNYLQSPQEYIQNSEELIPLEFYKITSPIFDSRDFKKSINNFTKKLSSKNDGYAFIYEWRFRIIDFNDFLNADYDIGIRGMLRHKGQKVLKNIKLLFDEGKGEVIFEDFCGYIDGYGRTFIRIYKFEDRVDFLLDVVINNNSRSGKKINYPYFRNESFIIKNKIISPNSISKII